MARPYEESNSDETWNMAKAYHMRIDNLLTLCVIYQQDHSGLKWYETLTSLYKEVYPKLKDEEKEKVDKMRDELRELKNQAVKLKRGIPTRKLEALELFLRQMLEDRHMLTPKPTDTSGL